MSITISWTAGLGGARLRPCHNNLCQRTREQCNFTPVFPLGWVLVGKMSNQEKFKKSLLWKGIAIFLNTQWLSALLRSHLALLVEEAQRGPLVQPYNSIQSLHSTPAFPSDRPASVYTPPGTGNLLPLKATCSTYIAAVRKSFFLLTWNMLPSSSYTVVPLASESSKKWWRPRSPPLESSVLQAKHLHFHPDKVSGPFGRSREIKKGYGPWGFGWGRWGGGCPSLWPTY